MRSKVAEETRRARIMAMTPAERIELAFALSEQGIEIYMGANNVDRETALQRLPARTPARPLLTATSG